jgi:hypothetical protein
MQFSSPYIYFFLQKKHSTLINHIDIKAFSEDESRVVDQYSSP